MRERIPDRGPLPIEVPGPLDLIRRGGDPPVEERPRALDVDLEGVTALVSSFLLRDQISHASSEVLPRGAEEGLVELGRERLREVDLGGGGG